MDCYDIELKTDLLEFDIKTVTAVINNAFTELARNFDSKKNYVVITLMDRLTALDCIVCKIS